MKKRERKKSLIIFDCMGEACVRVYRKVAAFLPITAKQHSFIDWGLGSTGGDLVFMGVLLFFTQGVVGATSEHLLFSIASDVVVK